MKIAIAHYYWDYPESEHGLPSALVRRGNQVILTVWCGDGGAGRTYETNGFRVHLLPGFNVVSGLGILNLKNPYVSGIGRIYDAFSPDIIDCQSHLFVTTLESLREAKKRGLPSVITVRGVMAKRDLVVNSAQKLYLYTLASRAFKEATLVRCLTRSDAAEVARYGCPQEKIRVIPNFVDTEAFRPSGEEGDHILWYGRFVEEKGVANLVEAGQSVIEKDPSASFILAGDGPLRDEVASMVAQRGLAKSFSMPGKVDRAGLLPLLREASIVVLPSLKEGMPFSLLEAMSSGKAVVASDIPGINDVVVDGETALLVPPCDPRSLAGAMISLRRDPSFRERLGAAARRSVLERFSEGAVVGRVEALYKEARGLTK